MNLVNEFMRTVDVIRQSQLIDKDCVQIILENALHFVDMMDIKSLVRTKLFINKFQFSHAKEFSALKTKIEEKLAELYEAEAKEKLADSSENDNVKEGEENVKPQPKAPKKLE